MEATLRQRVSPAEVFRFGVERLDRGWIVPILRARGLAGASRMEKV